jgi:hypothetical protein
VDPAECASLRFASGLPQRCITLNEVTRSPAADSAAIEQNRIFTGEEQRDLVAQYSEGERALLTPQLPRKSWEQIARENPNTQYVHEQASVILQREYPALTLRQLRRRYPHVQFRWPKTRVEREATQERNWAREVGRRTSWILLHFAGNVAIISCAFWLLLGLNKKASLPNAAEWFCIAVAASVFCHWRAERGASKIMKDRASCLAVWLCVTPVFVLLVAGMYGVIAYFILSLTGAPTIYCQLLAAMAGLFGIAQTAMRHKEEIADYLGMRARQD